MRVSNPAWTDRELLGRLERKAFMPRALPIRRDYQQRDHWLKRGL